jgi:hypothetical protein
MKVIMPECVSKPQWPDPLDLCSLILCRKPATNKLYTVILLDNDQVMFVADREAPITYQGLKYLKSEYEFIRYYRKGETLSITV